MKVLSFLNLAAVVAITFMPAKGIAATPFHFAVAPFAGASPQLPDPGNTGVSKEQQEQLGQQAVAQVYKQMPVLPDSSMETKYIQQLGKKLVAVIPQQYSWPFQFHVISQKEINAFALPGGPIFVNLGTITAAQNEAQLAGVMAHEISHIYMQHSIKQMKKQQTQQGIFGIVGAILGQAGGVAGTLGQLGLNIGSGLLSLKYSRSDEAQADSVGAIIMYKAGYNPVEMAEFFETLEAQGGSNGPNFLSDHPNPGNRVTAIQKEIQSWPSANFQDNNAEFLKVQKHASGLRAYSGQEIAQGAQNGTWAKQNQQSGSTPANARGAAAAENSSAPSLGNVTYAQIAPSGTFTQAQTGILNIGYPNNWRVSAADNGQGMTIAPAAGMSQGAVGYGVVINAFSDPNASTLDAATRNLVNGLEQSNPGLRATGGIKQIQVNGVEGRSVELSGNSPIAQNGKAARERDWLVTLPSQRGGLLYLVFIAPEDTFGRLQATYQRMLESVQLR
jgi:Zn-dependent protease with chaperone function